MNANSYGFRSDQVGYEGKLPSDVVAYIYRLLFFPWPKLRLILKAQNEEAFYKIICHVCVPRFYSNNFQQTPPKKATSVDVTTV